jgi:hypothetical protein
MNQQLGSRAKQFSKLKIIIKKNSEMGHQILCIT